MDFCHKAPKIPSSLHTPHSPNFLALQKFLEKLDLWNRNDYWGSSFTDEKVPRPPAKWKGKCNFNGTVCNNKLIGARDSISSKAAPSFDDEGHGTHTASTAAGNFVNDANVRQR